MSNGKLFIVATPIGNLGDMTFRAVETLKTVDYILAEDTRVAIKVLRHFQIEKQLIAYHEHSSDEKEARIIENLLAGSNYALVSDAGTPAVSDPGSRLTSKVVASGIDVVPIPGVSAVTALLSVCGLRGQSFHFWGFFPQKQKYQRLLLEQMCSVEGIHVFFESPFRIVKTLEKHFVDDSNPSKFTLVVGRELTKLYESIYRGSPAEVLTQIKADAIKGEFVVAVLCNSTSGE